jgi:4-hydroxybenzoate polyprenyltransferase
MTLTQRLDLYEKLMRLDKPIGILLLLWPTLWAQWLAAFGAPRPMVAVIFVLGVVLMRSAGCVINDYADRNFDGSVERTRNRPLAAKLISPGEALALAAVLCVLAFVLVSFLNKLTIQLSFAALAIAVIYPFLKRFFWLPQAWLGIAFGFGIPMSFAAVQNHIPPITWVLLLANVFWAMAYDTEYAMVDRNDDLKLGLRSTAILFGRHDVVAVMTCHAAFLLLVAYVGYRAAFGVLFYLGIVAAVGFVIYQYRLIRGREREGCFKAFMNNNWLGAAIFVGIVTDYAWRIPLFHSQLPPVVH